MSVFAPAYIYAPPLHVESGLRGGEALRASSRFSEGDLCRMLDMNFRESPECELRHNGVLKMMNWVTLDGVMQGPGHPDEDTRDGFAGALAVS